MRKKRSKNVGIQIIKEEVNFYDIDLQWPPPKGFYRYLKDKYCVCFGTVRRWASDYREANNIKVQQYKAILPGVKHPCVDCCLEKGLYRTSQLETNVCKQMRMFLTSKNIPVGYNGLVIGTPGPMFGSDLPNLHNILINDEAALIDEFALRCEKTYIVIGNIKDEKKAKLKATQWKARTTTRQANVYVAGVTSDTYREWIKRYVKDRTKWLKVILLTSGTWVGESKDTQGKYGFPVTFLKESLNLSKEYKNLHVIGLKKDGKYRFLGMHIHNGVETVIADSSKSDHLSKYISPPPTI